MFYVPVLYCCETVKFLSLLSLNIIFPVPIPINFSRGLFFFFKKKLLFLEKINFEWKRFSRRAFSRHSRWFRVVFPVRIPLFLVYSQMISDNEWNEYGMTRAADDNELSTPRARRLTHNDRNVVSVTVGRGYTLFQSVLNITIIYYYYLFFIIIPR